MLSRIFSKNSHEAMRRNWLYLVNRVNSTTPVVVRSMNNVSRIAWPSAERMAPVGPVAG